MGKFDPVGILENISLALLRSPSLITQSELRTSIILEGLTLPCCDWLDITSG